MKFSISNLAWQKKEEEEVLNLIGKKIKLLEFAPSLILKNLNLKKEILETKNYWKKKGISLYSMQSILYKTKNCYMFGNTRQIDRFFNEVKKKVLLAKALNTKIIVFGSPRNKKTFGKKKKLLDEMLFEMLKRISKICEKNKITFCLEANPKIYGTDYLTHTKDTIEIVKKINNKFLKVNLDLSTIISNKENYSIFLKKDLNFIGHAQISAPKLTNLLAFKKEIKNFINKLKKYGYKKVVSIETLPIKKNNLDYIKNILKLIN